MSKRKWIDKDNFDANIQTSLKYFEGMLRDDIIFDPPTSDALGKLGFQVDIERTRKRGSITLEWAYEDFE